MVMGSRQTGIDVVGVRPWGTHVCQFYETKDHLLGTLVPYFKAGLTSNERCVWVIADPLTETDARAALAEAVPALDRHFAERSIEIVPAREWYFEGDSFHPTSVIKRSKEKLADAVGRGYDGLRMAGQLSWLSATQWKAVYDYERALHESVSNQPMIVLCAYPVGLTRAAETLAVAGTHHVSLARRDADWEVFDPQQTRRLNADELRKSEQRWRAVFDNSAVGIVLQSADRTGRFVAANATYQRMLGYSEDELRALTFVDITYEEDRKANRRLAAELIDGKRDSFTLTKRNRRKDGSVMWVSIHVSLIPGTANDDSLFMSIVDDITERKHAEEALGRSERQFRALFEEAAVGISLLDSTGRLFESNRKLQQMLGYSADELRNMSWTAFTYPDDTLPIGRLVRDLLSGKRDYYSVERRYRRKDGSALWGAATVYSVRDERGKPMFNIGMVEDISERKRAEEALRKAEAELAHVTRLTTMGELAASIAHEVNQPLAAIVADAGASLNWLAATNPNLEKAREALAAIVKDGHRAADVVQRIRQLVTKTEPHKAQVDVNDALRDVLSLVLPQLRHHGVSLTVELASGLPPVRGDRVQLQQVMMNLAINGMEAMGAVTDRPRELSVQSRHESDHVVVTVQDSGTGIDPDKVDRVFDAFFTTKPGGMGMGLSICRSIIQAHGGRLTAGSNAGPGATFQFSLPAAP